MTTVQDNICVQSYDGQVAFFEGESGTFSRFLPNFLIPGPLCYWWAEVVFDCVGDDLVFSIVCRTRQSLHPAKTHSSKQHMHKNNAVRPLIASSHAAPPLSWRATDTACWRLREAASRSNQVRVLH